MDYAVGANSTTSSARGLSDALQATHLYAERAEIVQYLQDGLPQHEE
jgi:hypothetical protein